MNIYVSNLSFETSEENLKNIFLKFGDVTSVKIIVDRETSRSRGFAFINMPSEIEGHAALLGMNNKELGGRMLSVSVAKEKENHSGFKASSGFNKRLI